MNAPVARRSLSAKTPFHAEEIAPGVTLRRLHPGNLDGPNGEHAIDYPGGHGWSEIIMLGERDDPFIFGIPEVRMPPNQFWPMHWHDCWTIVLVLDGRLQIGDWYMDRHDVFVAAPSVEYGPLLCGPKGARILEIFADLALSPGGYGLEFHNHPILVGGDHAFKARAGGNERNEGKSAVPVDGTPGVWKTRLAPGWSWDLGAADDPDRGIVSDLRLSAGEAMAARPRGDWYGALVLDGSMEVEGRTLVRDDMLIARRGSTVPAITAGGDGVHLLENLRTSRAR